jgi:hypothetical protein
MGYCWNFIFNTDSINSNDQYRYGFRIFKTDTALFPFIKQDFVVTTFDGEYGADQCNPSAEIDGVRNYGFTRIDYRNGKKDIYAQFFNSNSIRIGPNLKVNDYPLSGNNSPLSQYMIMVIL